MLGVEARHGDLGAHEVDIFAGRQLRLGHQQRAAELPAGHQVARQQQVGHRAGEGRVGVRLGVRDDEVDHVDEGLARRGQPLGHRLRRHMAAARSAASVASISRASALAVAPPSRAVLRPTRSLAWIAVVPS